MRETGKAANRWAIALCLAGLLVVVCGFVVLTAKPKEETATPPRILPPRDLGSAPAAPISLQEWAKDKPQWWAPETEPGHEHGFRPNTFLRATKPIGDDDLRDIADANLLVERIWTGDQGDNITDAGLEHLGRVKSLREIWLTSSGENITDSGLEHLGQLKHLQNLSLYDCANITDDGLRHLGRLELLRGIDLSGAGNITDAGLAHLEQLENFEFVALSNTKVTDTGLERLGENLFAIHLAGPDITDAALKHSERWPNLWTISVRNSNITDDGLAYLGRLGNLNHANLSGNQNVTDAGLEHLGQLENLRSLRLPFNITDAGLKHLERLEKLETLDARWLPKVTDAGVAALKEKLPNCKIERY